MGGASRSGELKYTKTMCACVGRGRGGVGTLHKTFHEKEGEEGQGSRG